MNEMLDRDERTRTDFITEALETFLDFAEQEHIRNMNLFELVETVDAIGTGPVFAEQA